MDIECLEQDFGVNIEWGTDGYFPRFLESVKGKRVLILADRNTEAYADEIVHELEKESIIRVYSYPYDDLAADESALYRSVDLALGGAQHILAVGSGTLNDIAKYTGAFVHKPSSVFATAPSMDGYTSGVTPLILGGVKVTRPAQVVSNVLIDPKVIARSPRPMRGAGVGDMLAKHCSLADWWLAPYFSLETYDPKPVALMRDALLTCELAIPDLTIGAPMGAVELMKALIASGFSMVQAGSSRPASGAEHHISHYLEQYFFDKGAKMPLHGIKVGLGTLVSLYLYQTAYRRPFFYGQDIVAGVAAELPPLCHVEKVLSDLHCPTRFSQIGVPKDILVETFRKAYLLRDRFTILSLYCKKGLMDLALDELVERFY